MCELITKIAVYLDNVPVWIVNASNILQTFCFMTCMKYVFEFSPPETNVPYGRIDCSTPADRRKCFRDARPWCIIGRDDPVLGHCGVQEAMCRFESQYFN